MLNVETYESLLEKILNILSEDFDTGEGTLAYMLSSAMAMRLVEMYIELKNIEDDSYADTATGENLERVVALLGMERREKTKAIVRLEGDSNFEVGNVFCGPDMQYKIISKEDGYYLAECTSRGEAGNGYIGEVIPKDAVGEFSGMNIVKIVARGEEEEGDDELRERYLERLNCPICMGNLSYYKEVLNSLAGVGAAKVVPVNDESQEVKVIVTNESYEEAEEELIKYVKNVLDPEEYSGLGYGLAPVGHRVTVETAEKVDVNIVVEAFPSSRQKYIDAYARVEMPGIMKEINRDWGKTDQIVLRDRVIEDYYLSMGATDVNVVSINGQPNRIILEPNQILGGVSINAD